MRICSLHRKCVFAKRESIGFGLLCLTLVLAFLPSPFLCKLSFAAPTDVFNEMLSKRVIVTRPGEVVTLNRVQTPNMVFVISSDLPQGDLHLFAFIVTDNLSYICLPCTPNPFLPPSTWTTDFFTFSSGSAIRPYSLVNQIGKRLTFTPFKQIPTTHRLSSLLFGAAPATAVQNGDITSAHMVWINFVK